MKVDLDAALKNTGVSEWQLVLSAVDSADGTPVEGLDQSFFEVKLGESLQTLQFIDLEEEAPGLYSGVLKGPKHSWPETFAVVIKGAKGHTVFHGQMVGNARRPDVPPPT